MPAPASATADQIRAVNASYHDGAAAGYDAKWGIDYGQVGRQQVLGKVRKALGGLPSFGRALEVGAGTGYFSLNMLQAGIVGEATCTDISPGMLAALEGNAERLGLHVATAACDAAELPFEDGSFDLVFGHAVLHHLPELERSFAEFHRVLAPGGTLFFAGEPSRRGDRIAAVPKRVAWKVSPAWRAALRLPKAPHLNGHARAPGDDHDLEGQVDVHAFTPQDLSRHAKSAGFEDVRVRGEELLANWFGWTNRGLEASADPETVPMAWRQYAYHGYIALQKVDRALLEPRLPPAIFYNLILSASKPG